MKFIKDIFKNEPIQWGFRGDPETWALLKKSFENETNTYSQLEFKNELANRYNNIIKTKGERTSFNAIYFKDFCQMGMSGGHISIDWWEEIGLPLLTKRYSELNK